jgi:hypothetical protein
MKFGNPGSGEGGLAEVVNQGHHDQGREEAAGADDGREAQPRNVAETDDHADRVDADGGSKVGGKLFHHRDELEIHHLVPGSHRDRKEVVDAAHEGRDDQRLRLLAALLTRDVDLVDGRGLRERQLAVLLGDEVAPQRDQEEQAERRAQHRDDEDRQQHRQRARGHVHDVESGQREDRTGHDQPRSAADALHDDVFEDRVLPLEEPGDADGQDADRDRRLHHLRDLEPGVGRGDGEHDDHHDPDRHRAGGELRDGRPGRHVGLVGFAGLQFPVRRRVQPAAPAPLPFLLRWTHAWPPRGCNTRDATGTRRTFIAS